MPKITFQAKRFCDIIVDKTKTRTQFMKKATTYNGAKLWNLFPKHFKGHENVSSFGKEQALASSHLSSVSVCVSLSLSLYLSVCLPLKVNTVNKNNLFSFDKNI